MDNQHAGRAIYIAGATSQLIYSGKCVLVRIIVGKDVASGDIAIGDDLASSTVNPKAKFSSSTLQGVKECGIEFSVGIYAAHTNQTQVTYVVRPTN